jgi:hypothetical protein
MYPVHSVTSATDPHSPYAMIIAVGYMRIPHWNIRPTLSFWLKIRENLIYTITPAIQAVTLTFGFSQRFNYIPFLLLYESTSLGNLLQTFRENVRSHFLKGQNAPLSFSHGRYNKNFHRKIRETITQ